MLKRGIAGHQLIQLMLRKKADAQLAGFADFAFHRGQPVGNKFGQGGFALAIGAKQGDAIIKIKTQIDIAQHRIVIIADSRLFDHHQGRWQRIWRGELKAGHCTFRQGCDRLHFFQLFQS